MQKTNSPDCRVYVAGREPTGMVVGSGPLDVPLTASVAVEVNVGLRDTRGVGVSVTITFCVPMPTGVEGVWVAAENGVPVNARAVPVPNRSTSLMSAGV